MSPFLKIVDPNGRKIRASSFEGASTGRRLNTWGTSMSGPNTTLWSSLSTLRSRSRTLGRDNPLASGALDTWVANLIGAGLTPRWQTGDKGLNKELRELWDDSALEMDVDGVADFYGIQAIAARSMIESGEVFGKLSYRRKVVDLAVPLQLQLIEADHLDEGYNEKLSDSREIVMGIEFIGTQRKTYYFWKEHPGEMNSTSTRVPVPARNVLHLYRVLRPGQKRGRPWMAPIIVALHEADQLDDADLVRRKVQCMFGGFITKPPGDGGDVIGTSDRYDDDGVQITAMEPGTFPELPPGYEVDFAKPPQGDSGVDFHKHIQRQIAKGFGLTYDQFTGDLADINFTSLRAGLTETRRQMKMIQLHNLIHQFCRPFGNAWLSTAVNTKRINIKGFSENPRKFMKCKWSPDAFDYVKPKEDVETDVMRIRGGLASRQQICEERNIDYERLNEEIEEDDTNIDDKKLTLDTDPRKTSNSGQVQKEYSENDD